ncbi:MAG: hypothetical protein M2R45_00936 [Verrucomicrobia subdivision 3 bacterium]|nr:hypothetical protein [Limisphaerales bacterium]MCS1414605.1 hypothetical protein [Limisphaerales bacterium]
MALLATLPLQETEGASKFTETWNHTFSFSAKGSVTREDVNGPIMIEGWDRDEVYLSHDELKIKTEQLKSKKRGRLSLGKKGNSASVTHHVKAPHQANLKRIRSVNGTLKIIDVEGKIHAGTVNGNIKNGFGLPVKNTFPSGKIFREALRAVRSIPNSRSSTGGFASTKERRPRPSAWEVSIRTKQAALLSQPPWWFRVTTSRAWESNTSA